MKNKIGAILKKLSWFHRDKKNAGEKGVIENCGKSRTYHRPGLRHKQCRL